MRKIITLIFSSLLLLCVTACNLDVHPLGNNLVVWEGDVREDRMIAYCTGNCSSGIHVVPTYNRQFDSKGRYAEFVVSAKANREWVIVKTIHAKNGTEYYYLIKKGDELNNLHCLEMNCDSILQTHVLGPWQFKEFLKKKDSLRVDLNF